MNYATISADVISYTSLTNIERRKLEANIKDLLSQLTSRYQDQKFYGRLIQGDYIECAMKSSKYSLRIALLLKTFIKSIEFSSQKINKTRLKYFFEHGIRLAIAVAPLITFDPQKGIIDGEAIYLSGRAIKDHTTSHKQKVVIKNTMFFYSNDTRIQDLMDPLFSLLDTIVSKCSAKQSEVVYYKLLEMNEKEISKKLKKYQSTISQHSTAAGWLSIEKAVNYFEKVSE